MIMHTNLKIEVNAEIPRADVYRKTETEIRGINLYNISNDAE